MEINVSLPQFIAFCGHPGCGKTTAAEILVETFNCKILDTGMPLREIAVRHLGLDWDQVMTQEGKASFVDINGIGWQVRKILGDLGKKFEDLFGEEIMPFMSHQSVMDEIENGEQTTYIDPSCRKVQGHYWKRNGGIVIGIRNPLTHPSIYEFDAFDEAAVDFWIDNDGLAKGMSKEEAMRDLEGKLVNALIKHCLESTFADAFQGSLAA